MVLYGSCRFPITFDGQFGGTFQVTTTDSPVSKDIIYRPIKPHYAAGSGSMKPIPWVYFDDRLMKNADVILSVVSSFQAMALDGDQDPRMYVTLHGIQSGTSLNGASEGLAMLLALMRLVCPNNFCATGYVAAIGSTGKDIDNLEIMPVDSVTEKVRGATSKGLTIMVPRRNDEAVRAVVVSAGPYARIGGKLGVVECANVGDAKRFLSSIGVSPTPLMKSDEPTPSRRPLPIGMDGIRDRVFNH